MDDSEFEAQVDALLERTEQAFEAAGVDVDLERPAAGILEIGFPNGTKIIVSRHGASREVWVAARSGGFHYRWDGTAWRDSRDGTEFFPALSKFASVHSGQVVIIA